MASSILTSADYPQVRAAISVEWDAKMLPDSIIALPAFQGLAERWAKERVLAWATVTDCQLERLKLAICLKTAALLIPSLPHTTQENFNGEGSFTKVTVDWVKRAAELHGQAENEISGILGEPIPPDQVLAQRLPTFFTSVTPSEPYRLRYMPVGEPKIVARRVR
jgi:hypothetical protein